MNLKRLLIYGLIAASSAAIAGTIVIDPTEQANPIPSAITTKAAYWANMSDASVVSGDEGATLSRWRDARETATTEAMPTFYYAEPAWTNGGSSTAVSYEYKGVNPAIETMGFKLRKTLNFHGRSGIYLRLKKNGSDAVLDKVQHVFAVHNPSNWFGSIIGSWGAGSNRKGGFMLYPVNNSYVYSMYYASAKLYPFFWYRTDLCYQDTPNSIGHLAQATDVAVDGERIDPFSYYPHKGWQLFDASFRGGTSVYSRFESIFFQRYEAGDTTYATGHRAGGDYLSELIVFTNQLSEIEIASIRSYLNTKWGLPSWRDPDVLTDRDYLVQSKAVSKVDLEAETNAQVTVAADTVSRPLAFAGDGTVEKMGEGALVIGASQGLEPFAGTLSLNAGSVYLRGGAPLPMEVVGGETITSEDYIVSGADISKADWTQKQADGGIRITKTTGGEATTFTKAGKCPAVVSSVSEGVKKVVVEGGELTLGKPSSVGYRGEVEIPNGDFEAEYTCPSGDSAYGYWAYNICRIPVGSVGSNNWYSYEGTAFFQRVGRGCKFADGTLVEDATTSEGKKWQGAGAWNVYTTVGNGNQILNIQGGGAYTKVRLPTAGTYELSFDLSSRFTYANDKRNAKPVVIKFGDAPSSWQPVAYVQATALRWSNVKVVLPKHEAGEVVIGFYLQTPPENVSVDCSAYFDNVKLRFLATEERDTYAIPNGDFEQMDMTWIKDNPSDSKNWIWSYNYFSLTNRAVNWTFAPTTMTSDGLNPYVGLVNPNISIRYRDGWAPMTLGENLGGTDTHGTTALLMAGPTPTATTTFTPPAGTWTLRHRVLYTHVYSNGKFSFYGVDSTPATCDASVSIGGSATSLGRISVPAKGRTERFTRYDYPTTFTTDGSTPVTLTLSTPGNANFAIVVDDLELVGENSVADKTGELVKNGDFEEEDNNWVRYTPALPEGLIKQVNNSAEYHKYLCNSTAHNYGTIRYSGLRSMLLKNLGGARQDIAFPKAGLYRLRFAFRSRSDDTCYANGAFAVKLWQGEITNQIAYLNYQYQCNFTEREYLFEVPVAGTYTLGFENYGPNTARKAEATCLLDGVSVCAVDWDVPETISLDEDAKIALANANGAQLNLAFTGTNIVQSVRCGGKGIGTKVGNMIYVNRETCPKLISGLGTLAYRPQGFLIIYE